MAERYMALNGKYLEDADKLLAEGDYVQASEKYWGAVAEMVKAIAEQRGWRHHSHRELREAVSRLADEMSDREVRRLFSIAESLHANFYEDWMQPEDVRTHADDAHAFVEKLRPLAA
jgi:hypothetical protein